MSRIIETWQELLRQAIARDEDTRQYAVFQIALILERHHQPNQDAPDLYEENLSRDLLRLTLSHERQNDAIQYLLQLTTNHPARADAYLYAVASANPALTTPLLLPWLQDHASQLQASAIYQIVMALTRAWRLDDASLQAQIRDHATTLQYLEQWANHADEDLAHRAEQLYELIQPTQ